MMFVHETEHNLDNIYRTYTDLHTNVIGDCITYAKNLPDSQRILAWKRNK